MKSGMEVFEELESQARSYCRKFPKVFSRAVGSIIYDDNGNEYMDFLACAGSVNYGHNPPALKKVLCEYIMADGIQAALDFHTEAKLEFISVFRDLILRPRNLDYRLQFTSPTGTSVVESAVKLARKVTGRRNVIAFTNGYHGMTGTSLGLTGSQYHRQQVQDREITRMPFDGYMGAEFDSLAFLRKMLEDFSSGIDMPAAIIVETVQGEGGVNLASKNWLVGLSELSKKHGILLIVDDIQAGCGRTGKFFSFEFAEIVPDLVCLSKSIGGYGVPLSVLLIAPEHDQWLPAEDNGTFRGNTMAFVTGAEALKVYWADNSLEQHIARAEVLVKTALNNVLRDCPAAIVSVRGRGMFYGIEFADPALAAAVTAECFKQFLIIERCGPDDQVIKVFPALTIDFGLLQRGLTVLCDIIRVKAA